MLRFLVSLMISAGSCGWALDSARAEASNISSEPGSQVRELELILGEDTVEIAGRRGRALQINGQIPGPTLRWREGDIVRIHVRNTLEVSSSLHWHGLLLPNRQDGVPGLTNLPIAPASSHTFEFPLRQAGTYWYHAHTGLQEQRGLYGAIVIEKEGETRDYDRDHVLVLSDWTFENPDEILRLLKSGSHTFALQKGSVQSLWGAVRAGALKEYLKREWARMPPMHVSDVAYDAFLTNGRVEEFLAAEAGERIRLRIINAAASSYFYLGLGGAALDVIAADGQDVEQVEIPRILMGIAETYDVIVTAPERGAIEFRATAQDGSGRTSLWIGSRHAFAGHEGHRMQASDVPPPDLYGGNHGMSDASMAGSGSAPEHEGMSMPHGPEGGMPSGRPLAPYASLRAAVDTSPPPQAPIREIRLRLTGDMERYVWSFDGRTLAEADVIRVRRGEVLRLTFENETMMHHPLHLHGHFFRVLNGEGARAPRKHTLDVPPMGEVTIEFFADQSGDWFFHCHILYHMMSGMSRIFHYEDWQSDPELAPSRASLLREHWYVSAHAALLSNFTVGEITTSSTRHELGVEWRSGWKESSRENSGMRRTRMSRHSDPQFVPGRAERIHYEVLISYRYHFNRFYRFYMAEDLNDRANRFVFGAEILLPMNLLSRVWVDSRGQGRIKLARDWQLTSRLHAETEVEYDSFTGWEGETLFEYTLNRYLGLTAGWDSDFGWGGGLSLRY